MTADLSVLIDQLKEKAGKATPGPWANAPSLAARTDDLVRHAYIIEDAAFIVAAHPQVVAALAEVAQAAATVDEARNWPMSHDEEAEPNYYANLRALMRYLDLQHDALAHLRRILAGEETA